MPRNGNGTFVPVADSWNPAISGTVISSADWATTLADIVAGLTQSLSKDGQTPLSGNLNYGGSFKNTNMAAGTAATDSVNLGQVAAAAYAVATVGGTADAITLTPSPAITAYATGQTFQFTATGTNTTAVTVAVSGLTTKAVQANSAALVAGDIVSGRTYVIRYDGTQFQLFSSRAAVSHTADIADNAVTFAKMQAITDGTLLGASGGTAVEQITVGSGLSLSSNTLSADGAVNVIINGGMQINQRLNTVSQADDTYFIDRWYTLTQTSTITVAQNTNGEDGTPFYATLTQAQASAQRMGLAQIVESGSCRFMRGQTVALNARVRISNSQAIRYAILEWTGAADGAITSDVVNDWTSGTYTTGNFFVAANFTIAAVGSMTPAANTWTTLTTLTASISSSLNNLIVFFWTEGTAAQNVTLDISRVQCAIGSTLPQFVWGQFGSVLEQCLRFYQKSFDYTVKPAQSVGGTSGVMRGPQTVAASTANNGGLSYLLPVKLRKNSPTAISYNPANANTQAYNATTGTDCSATSIGGDENVVFITFTSPGGSAAGNVIYIRWTLDAEL